MQCFSIRQVLAAQLILLTITLTACQKTKVPFPEELIGIWISEHEQYKDKYIVVSRNAVSFGSDKGINLTAFVKKYSKKEPEGEWTLFCEDKGGVSYNIFLIVQKDQGEILLKLKHREHVLWKKLKVDEAEMTQLFKQANPKIAQSEEQNDEINTDGLEATSVEGDSIVTGSQQSEQNQEPVKQPDKINTDGLEATPVEGDSRTSWVQQRELNLYTEKKPEIKPLQPRKVVLGFKPNSLELTDRGRAVFDVFLAKLKQYPRATVWLKGFVSAKTNSAENVELSRRRAQAVEQLMFKAGIDPIQVEIVGMGNKDPIASNDTRAGREKNRRVEIEVISDGTELRKR